MQQHVELVKRFLENVGPDGSSAVNSILDRTEVRQGTGKSYEFDEILVNDRTVVANLRNMFKRIFDEHKSIPPGML